MPFKFKLIYSKYRQFRCDAHGSKGTISAWGNFMSQPIQSKDNENIPPLL
jgi:hypothetical protein